MNLSGNSSRYFNKTMNIIVHSWGKKLLPLVMYGKKTLEDLGLEWRPQYIARYLVVDKKKFMLSVIEYEINWSLD